MSVIANRRQAARQSSLAHLVSRKGAEGAETECILADSMTLSYAPTMLNRAHKPVTVTLGPLADMARARVETGRYGSVSEVVRAGLRALEREEQALDAILKARVEEALADPQPPIAQADVFADLRERHEARRIR